MNLQLPKMRGDVNLHTKHAARQPVMNSAALLSREESISPNGNVSLALVNVEKLYYVE